MTLGATNRCPCGSASPYDRCCGPLHHDEREAATAEQLMRARYCAYSMNDEDFLLRSWHPSTRPRLVWFDPDEQWVRLDVLTTTGGGLLDADGTVEFDAHHQRGNTTDLLHELSHFVRHDGRWVYLGSLDLDIR